jgi:hypothetical protein
LNRLSQRATNHLGEDQGLTGTDPQLGDLDALYQEIVTGEQETGKRNARGG